MDCIHTTSYVSDDVTTCMGMVLVLIQDGSEFSYDMGHDKAAGVCWIYAWYALAELRYHGSITDLWWCHLDGIAVRTWSLLEI